MPPNQDNSCPCTTGNCCNTGNQHRMNVGRIRTASIRSDNSLLVTACWSMPSLHKQSNAIMATPCPNNSINRAKSVVTQQHQHWQPCVSSTASTLAALCPSHSPNSGTSVHIQQHQHRQGRHTSLTKIQSTGRIGRLPTAIGMRKAKPQATGPAKPTGNPQASQGKITEQKAESQRKVKGGTPPSKLKGTGQPKGNLPNNKAQGQLKVKRGIPLHS